MYVYACLYVALCQCSRVRILFVFNDTATTTIYTYGHTLSLHDALPIYRHWRQPPWIRSESRFGREGRESVATCPAQAHRGWMRKRPHPVDTSSNSSAPPLHNGAFRQTGWIR